MRKIIGQTTNRVFERGQWWDKTETDTIEVPDPTPTPAPVRTLRTNTPTCAHCHQAQTACRCLTPQPHAQAQDNDDGWMPKSILNTRDKESPPVTMSAETRALRTQYDQWDRAFLACRSHTHYIGHSDDLRACSTPQLLSVFARLERGEVIDGVRDAVMESWAPKGLLNKYPRKP